MKKIIICADDYGQNEFISEAILELVKSNRLSAISCMTQAGQWSIYGYKLRCINKKIDVGLHFDLTHFDSMHKFSLVKLMLRSCLGKIDLYEIELRLNAQLDSFEAVMGCPPDYLDGHQHVHVFPGIDRCIFKVLKQRYGKSLPYLRQVNPTLLNTLSPIKAFVLRLCSLHFNKRATQNGFRLTSHFFGLYSLKPLQYPLLFKQWLAQAPSNSLIMCHPGYRSTATDDPIKAIRVAEYNYLISKEFLQDLKNNHAVISCFDT